MNCVFAYPDHTLAAAATITGSWTNLSNLKNPLRSKKASATKPLLASQIKTYFGTAAGKSVGVVSLIDHNASRTATIRISLHSTTAYNESSLVKTVVDGIEYRAETCASGSGLKIWHSPWYPDGTDITADDAASYQVVPDWHFAFPVNHTAPYMLTEITDTDGTVPTLQLGRLFAGKKYSPAINIDYGNDFAWRQDVSSERSIGGVQWDDLLSQGREINASFGLIDNSDSQLLIMDRQRLLGTSGELYFILDPAAATGILRTKAMLCRFKDANPLTMAAYNFNRHSFGLEEVR